MDRIRQLDEQLLVWLNSFNSPFFDDLMILVTGRFIWVPLYALIILFIYKNGNRYWWVIILTLIALVVSTDLFASAFLKPLTERLRPCHEIHLASQLHLPNGCGGKYGFISSHSSNTFALASFLWLQFRRKFPWMMLFFIWATVVSYSRIYLAAHYPGDIIAGAISGFLFAFLYYKFFQKVNSLMKTRLKGDSVSS